VRPPEAAATSASHLFGYGPNDFTIIGTASNDQGDYPSNPWPSTSTTWLQPSRPITPAASPTSPATARTCASTAINTDSELIPVTRANSVTAVVTRPTGSLIAGQSALINLAGWLPPDKVRFLSHI
jgi:hypothetical protein